MAVYKGREVQILGPTTGENASPMYNIVDQWGERSSVKLNELLFTSTEIEDQKKQKVDEFASVRKIEDKDLQELKDGQDKQKIESKQGKVSPGPVEVSKVWVDPAEVKEKSTPVPVTSAPVAPPSAVTVTEKPVSPSTPVLK
jgi:hypothetical protein